MNKNKEFNVIHIRDYYPSKENPANSPWVYDQVISLKKYNYQSLVISPTPYIPSIIRKNPKFYLYSKPSNKIENYLDTNVIRPVYYKIPGNKLIGINLFFLTRSINSSAKLAKSPAIIHAHFGQNGVAALKLKKSLQIPLITSFYGYDTGRLSSKFKPFYQKLARDGDLFLALSKNMKLDLINLGFPQDKIIIHHLGIDLHRFSVSSKNKTTPFVFLVVARLSESKGVQDVIQAFHKICTSEMQIHIVGDGIYKNDLMDLVKSLKLENQILFINNFKADNPRGVVLDEMQNCDVAILTSFTPKNKSKEGTPVVLMEAQACGKPCIATKHAGIPEVVVDSQTGFLVNERDVENIAIKMKLLYTDTQLRKDMGDRARLYIENEFNQQIQMLKLAKLYNNITS